MDFVSQIFTSPAFFEKLIYRDTPGYLVLGIFHTRIKPYDSHIFRTDGLKILPLSSVRQNTTIIPAVTGQHIFRIKGKNFLPSNSGYNLRRFHLPQKTNKNKLQEEAKNTKKVKIPKNQKQRKYAHKNQLCAILNN